VRALLRRRHANRRRNFNHAQADVELRYRLDEETRASAHGNSFVSSQRPPGIRWLAAMQRQRFRRPHRFAVEQRLVLRSSALSCSMRAWIESISIPWAMPGARRTTMLEYEVARELERGLDGDGRACAPRRYRRG
jgi:hypothetical protein